MEPLTTLDSRGLYPRTSPCAHTPHLVLEPGTTEFFWGSGHTKNYSPRFFTLTDPNYSTLTEILLVPHSWTKVYSDSSVTQPFFYNLPDFPRLPILLHFFHQPTGRTLNMLPTSVPPTFPSLSKVPRPLLSFPRLMNHSWRHNPLLVITWFFNSHHGRITSTNTTRYDEFYRTCT